VGGYRVNHLGITSHLGQLSLPSLRLRRRLIEYQPFWLAGVRRGTFSCVGWQVTLCDPMRQDWEWRPVALKCVHEELSFNLLTFNFGNQYYHNDNEQFCCHKCRLSATTDLSFVSWLADWLFALRQAQHTDRASASAVKFGGREKQPKLDLNIKFQLQNSIHTQRQLRKFIKATHYSNILMRCLLWSISWCFKSLWNEIIRALHSVTEVKRASVCHYSSITTSWHATCPAKLYMAPLVGIISTCRSQHQYAVSQPDATAKLYKRAATAVARREGYVCMRW